MTYKPLLRPDLVEMGCNGGFCEPPTCLLEELNVVSSRELEDIIRDSDISKKLIDKIYELHTKAMDNVDKEVINNWEMGRIMDRHLEMATLELTYNITSAVRRRLENEGYHDHTDSE
jgi:hypothetical protein